jgi:hypothetical protein
MQFRSIEFGYASGKKKYSEWYSTNREKSSRKDPGDYQKAGYTASFRNTSIGILVTKEKFSDLLEPNILSNQVWL